MMNTSEQSVLHMLAFHYLWNGQPQKAEPLYEVLMACAPDQVRVRAGLAYAQLCNGKPKEALKSMEPLVDDPDPVVQLLLGRAFLMVGDEVSARQAMRQFCQNRPSWNQPVLVDVEEGAKKGVRDKNHA